MPEHDLSPSILRAALEGLEIRQKRIEEQIAEVRTMLSGQGEKKAAPATAPKGTKPAKRELSAAARQRIAAAQKKRWKAFREAKANASA